MILQYEGRTYEFDLDDLDIDQAIAIEKHIGGPMLDWEQGMATGRALCVQVLGWLILAGGDLGTPISSVKFKYPRLMTAFSEASAEEAARAEAETPDPTAAAASNGRTSGRVSSPSG